jgi:hypothetical protein
MPGIFGGDPFLVVSKKEYDSQQEYRLAFRNLKPDRQTLLRIKDLSPSEFYAMELLIKIIEISRIDRMIAVKPINLNVNKTHVYNVSEDDLLLNDHGEERAYLLEQLPERRASWQKDYKEPEPGTPK